MIAHRDIFQIEVEEATSYSGVPRHRQNHVLRQLFRLREE